MNPTSNGGISVDSSGHVTVDGQQMPTAGALSHRNLVSNGAMLKRAAQRGTSGVTSSSGAYLSVDRINVADGGTWTIDQSSTAPDGFANSHKMTCTTADASPNWVRNIYGATD